MIFARLDQDFNYGGIVYTIVINLANDSENNPTHIRYLNRTPKVFPIYPLNTPVTHPIAKGNIINSLKKRLVEVPSNVSTTQKPVASYSFFELFSLSQKLVFLASDPGEQ